MQSISLGRAQAAPVASRFGRQINRQELALLHAQSPDNLRPELSFAIDVDAAAFENAGTQAALQLMKHAPELLGDAIKLMTLLRRQGMPEQDQPIYFVLKGQLPPLPPGAPIQLDLGQALRDYVKGPAKFLLKGFGLNIDTLPNTALPAGGYTREDARAALQALVDSPNARPVNEAVVLMNVLLNRTRPEDLIQLDARRFALRLVLPGRSQSA